MGIMCGDRQADLLVVAHCLTDKRFVAWLNDGVEGHIDLLTGEITEKCLLCNKVVFDGVATDKNVDEDTGIALTIHYATVHKGK